MAERRMFSKTIIDSDAFLSMPMSTQALYFHLAMRADDDGIILNALTILRGLCLDTDVLDLLVATGWMTVLSDGCYGIAHWEEHSGIAETAKKRRSYKYRSWRQEVLIRDSYTCQHCGKQPAVLHVHHKKSFAGHPELRYELDNGISLCKECHLKAHGGRWYG